MVLHWSRVRLIRIRSGQVGKSTCQGTHVIVEITEINPLVLYLPADTTRKLFDGDLYSLPEIGFCFSSSGCLRSCAFALPLIDLSFRFLGHFRYY